MEIAVNYAAEKGKKGQMDFSQARAEEDSGEWVLTGTCGSDEEPTGEERFRIVISSEGKVESADFSPIAKKGTAFSRMFETPKKVEPSTELFEDSSEEEESAKSLPEKGTVFRDDFDRTVKKIESLMLAEQQLYLEREKLLKELEGKAVNLEQRIKDIRSDIKRIKGFLNQENFGVSSPDLEMQVVAAE